MEVVGLVAGTRQGLTDSSPGPHLFVPFGQHSARR